MLNFVIVTPSLNSARFINETIHSVVSQAGDFSVRYHIQDGGSSDHSLESVTKWDALIKSGSLPLSCNGLSFSYSSERDAGLYDAINRGFQSTGVRDGDCMCWINADDILAPGALATVAEIFASFGNVMWVSGRTAHIDERGLLKRHYKLRPYTRRLLKAGLHDGRFLPLLSQEGTMWKAALWRLAGGLDTRFRLAADYDLWRRFADHAQLAMMNATLGYFRIHPDQKSSDLASYYAEIDTLPGPGVVQARADAARTVLEAGVTDTPRSAEAASWLFIAYGAGSNLVDFRNESEASIRRGIFAALEANQPDIMLQYFDLGVRPDIRNDEGTPLYVEAVLQGNVEAFDLCESIEFPKAGEDDLHVRRQLQKALVQAIAKSNTFLVRKIIGLGVPVNEKHGDHPLPLLMAVYIDNASIAKLLIQSGADVNARNDQASPVLLDAIFLDRVEQVRLLLDSGADPSLRNSAGVDALSCARQLGHEQIVTDLEKKLGKGKSVSARSFGDMVLDVCVCTHNPRRDVFDVVLSSIARQTVDRSRFRVLIVDNASTPALEDSDFRQLAGAQIEYRIVREPRLGNVFSRATAIAESTSDWILFVDDDNELAPDYIAHGLDVLSTRPDLGCFGGRLALAPNLNPPGWMRPLLPYLAVRDFGNEEITNVANYWGQWEPATAGGFIHRSVLNLYIDRIKNDSKVHELGRKGKRSLNSGEDSLMMWGAHEIGLAASYQPGLRLIHHINSDRFRFRYFFRLMRGYGKSNAILDKLYSRGNPPLPAGQLLRQFRKDGRSLGWKYALCLAAYHIGYNLEVRTK